MHDLHMIQGPIVTRDAREKIAFFPFHAFMVEDSRFQQNQVWTKLYKNALHAFVKATLRLRLRYKVIENKLIAMTGLEPCCLKSLTMYKWAIEPFDIVTIRIHNHDLIAADWHGQQKDCTKRHCQGKGAKPKAAKCHVLSYK